MLCDDCVNFKAEESVVNKETFRKKRKKMTASSQNSSQEGLRQYYVTKVEKLQLTVTERNQNLRRLQAQRNELNAKVRMLSEELQLLVRNLNCRVDFVLKILIFFKARARILCWRGGEGHGQEKSLGKSSPRRKICGGRGQKYRYCRHYSKLPCGLKK